MQLNKSLKPKEELVQLDYNKINEFQHFWNRDKNLLIKISS